MGHTAKWYDDLAISLGHRGFLTLDEIERAEASEAY